MPKMMSKKEMGAMTEQCGKNQGKPVAYASKAEVREDAGRRRAIKKMASHRVSRLLKGA